MNTSYDDFTPNQKERINEIILMLSEIDGSNVNYITGVFKTSMIIGHIPWQEGKVIEKKSPYLLRIILGGLATSMVEYHKRQRSEKPWSIIETLGALLKYDDLVVHTFIAHRKKVNGICTETFLSQSIRRGMFK